MPCPLTAYIRTARATSRQPSPQPQATGTAATIARNGTAMKTARAAFSQPALGSVVRAGSGAGRGAAAATSGATAVAALGGGVMGILWFGVTGYATVTY